MRRFQQRYAFSLIELLAAGVILGVVVTATAAVFVPMRATARGEAREPLEIRRVSIDPQQPGSTDAVILGTP